MTEPTHPSPSFDPHVECIRFEQVDALFRNVAIGVLGALAAAALIAWTLVEVDNMPASGALEWLAVGCALVTHHLLWLRAYTGARRLDMDPRPWAYGFVACAVADGVWWSIALVVLAGPERVGEQYLILLFAFTVANGAVSAFGSYLPAFYAIFFPITLTATAFPSLAGRPA